MVCEVCWTFSSRLRLISADQGGSHVPTDRWFVSEGYIELLAGVDKKMGMGSTELEDRKALCIAESTLVCTKRLDDTERITLPEALTLDHTPL